MGYDYEEESEYHIFINKGVIVIKTFFISKEVFKPSGEMYSSNELQASENKEHFVKYTEKDHDIDGRLAEDITELPFN